MLSFEQKQKIIETFPELTKKEISLNRLNYHYDESLYEKTIVVEKLHPNGNGFVYVGDLLKYESEVNEKGLVNIRDYNESKLREILEDAINYLSVDPDQPIIEKWTSKNGAVIELIYEKRSWNVYYEQNLEESFGTREAAVSYLQEDGFKRKD
ncbi:hypothetical protein [Ureibacillus manganicus]|uniref:Uncharacterized protein n=1 Tax=Ureibacillus manganicus DSM 26584 TaxID=1384049 RepID=A0A0A3ISQ4_9BACL|nr:hypothetical protein [Ureibacillus manganicus]KGR77842.1 hypothetical protein CD29_13200 [Ureibacillus manganicus DSM 26584]